MVVIVMLLCFTSIPCSVLAFETEADFSVTGYVRTWASVNLNDPPETEKYDAWELSMLRGTILLDATAVTAPIPGLGSMRFNTIVRADKEYRNDYLDRLEDKVKSGLTAGGPGSDIMETYDNEEFREYNVEFDPVDRLRLILGRQQIVWGETDFFRAMDVVHGYDMRWRAFLESENEELRKPLVLLNSIVQVPELGGSFQAFVRPGWDRDKWIGNTVELSGGRWATQPYKGVDFLALVDMNYHHEDGDVDDPTYGCRWYGLLGDVDYTLSYLKTFNNDPVANSRFAQYKETPNGMLGDFIYPEIDIVGATLRGYNPALDVVLSTEIVYTFDAPFNIGTEYFTPDFGLGPVYLPGFGGIKKKDTLLTMVRFDKTLRRGVGFLHCARPPFLSVQLFDRWIMSYDKHDDLVDAMGHGAPLKEHSTIMTVIFVANYKSDRINPGLAGGIDLTHKGGFLIPSCEFVFGNHWRLRAEADFFFYPSSHAPDNANPLHITGEVEKDTHLFGYFANNDQFLLRLTYQF